MALVRQQHDIHIPVMEQLEPRLLLSISGFDAQAPEAIAYEALQGPTEVRYWDESNADNGYTLFGSHGTSYLLDMEGRVVNTWSVGTNPSLLDNGNLLDAATDNASGFDGFQELDWDGNVVWEYYESRQGYDPHDDFIRIFNDDLGAYTTLYIADKDLTHDECINAGADPTDGPYDDARTDVIVEVDMAGNIVWEWSFFDHIVQDIDPTKANYGGSGQTMADHPDKLNLNLPGRPIGAAWLDCNSLDYNASLDQIVINSALGEFYVIDHGNTFVTGDPAASIALAAGDSGDFLYRFGDPARYEQGDPPSVREDWTKTTTGHKQIGGSSDVQWIDAGLPGAGNFLVFNNGQYLFESTSQSYIFEINPFMNSGGIDAGAYVNPPDAGYYTLESPHDTHKERKNLSNQVVWMYNSESNLTLFSHIGSSVQRLPNGNTLICATTEGYLLEVTAGSDVAWEYVNPITNDGIVEEMGDNVAMTNAVFSAHRYQSDHPAFAGRDMTPGDTITGAPSDYLTGPDYQAMQGATEMRHWDEGGAYNGYTLFGARGTSYLLDMQGCVVNTWPAGTNPRLLEYNGHLLDASRDDPSGFGGFQELDWGGNVVWEYQESRAGYDPHHDFVRIFNSQLNDYTTLYIANKTVTHDQAIAAGCDPANGPYDGAQMDAIVEIDMDGNIVWEWWFFDHVVQDIDPTKANYVGDGNTIADYPGKIDLNLPGRPVKRDWLHCNSLDYNPDLDQIVINSVQGEFYVIDHGSTFLVGDPAGSIALAATDAGDFLYRFGDPARYAEGDPPSILEDWTESTSGHKQIGGAHDIQWIDSGLPGVGNFLVFNNGQYLAERTPQSYIVEINPFLDANGVNTGHYVPPPDAGYTTQVLTDPQNTGKQPREISNQVVWTYGSESNLTMFSHIDSGAQRLPNGNTLICSDTEGHFLEVTPAGQVVWEYISPITPQGIAETIGDNLPMTNAVFRAYRYGTDYAAFVGRDMTPGDPITGDKAPTITGTTHTPAVPTSSDPVWVTSTVTDDGGVAGVTLTYDDGSGTGPGGETVVFQETMRTEAVKPWTGDGSDNPWTITVGPTGIIEQRTQANYGTGNPCGLEFGTGTNDEADTMIETAQGIDARGASGYVEFWLWAGDLEGTDGWTFQLDSGSGYVTRLSELTGSNHDWQQYHYDLGPTELVSDLKMRFQFRAGDQGDRIRLDSIYVTVNSGGESAVELPMYDDGAHQDGAAGDGLYGAQIPACPEGTSVSYYVAAVDDAGGTTNDPVAAPGVAYSYTVVGDVPAWTMLALPDTGQTGDHTATFGEDSDFTFNPPSYTDNGNGMVTDNVTGLMWQQADGGEMTWDDAVVYAESLTLGGHSDWRLPFSHELFSIVDHGRGNPALNTDYFSESNAQYWWSGDERADDPSRVWVTNAGGGIGAHPKSETISAGGTKRIHVRCVRDESGSAPGVLTPAFTDNGDATVTDDNTALQWQQEGAASPMAWEQALAYAEGLSLGGHDDWRLPNIKELRSISDDALFGPSVDATYFTDARAEIYWSSTTELNNTTQAWAMDAAYGLVSYEAKSNELYVRCVRGGLEVEADLPELVAIPAGEFEMGDHYDLGGAEHQSDEVPLHTVQIDAFQMGATEITNRQYCGYLNAALASNQIEVRNGFVYAVGGNDIYAETTSAVPYSGISWDGSTFSVLTGRDEHPMVGVRWHGAAAYTNWLSSETGHDAVYNLATWEVDFAANGYRLPTEAEWEYAARGGQYYNIFPWGNDENADGTLANWPNSGDPYETGAYPWTTPVGFYNGEVHNKADFAWPGGQTSYQTSDGSNAYGLYDMSGNVWEWCNDWYARDYYSQSPSENPQGPEAGDPMPDGNTYHVLRSGNWFNGEQYWGHSRTANRNPAYYRGPDDPDHAYYHVGFRVVLAEGAQGVCEPGATLQTLAESFTFAEGPAVDADGNVFFSDVAADIIYQWSVDDVLSTFRENSGGTNGLFFDQDGNLLACEGDNGRVVSIDPLGNATVLADEYGGMRFNEPNDLWIDPDGGVYFSDPVYWGSLVQDGEHVYYLSPDHTNVIRVIDDLIRPNGIIGTPDGQTLYVSDHGAATVYRYDVNPDGTLSNKTLFAPVGSDGMTIDNEGHIYLTEDDVLVYDSAGNQIEQIAVPERPTNVCFGGSDNHTLFVTTETAFHSIRMRVQGVSQGNSTAPMITGTAHAPALPTENDPVWVTTTVTDDGTVADVTLTYDTGTGGGEETTVFLETMGVAPAKPWTGDGCDNAWTVTAATADQIEQRTQTNYGEGNPCGMEFRTGTTDENDFMIETAQGIDATGTSGYVEFWIQTLDLEGTDGWTFQLDSGSGYVTRLSELTGSNHNWQLYRYNLDPTELVGDLKMRFQFRGGDAGDKILLDYISVVTTSGSGGGSVEVPMFDDGAHQDGAAGDGVYGAQIPGQPAGTTVAYYITATDDTANQTADPATAPGDTYFYVVAASQAEQTVGLFVYDTDLSYDGYTLFAPKHNTNTYLIDNYGRVVHSWTASTYEPGQSVYLLENGNLLRTCFTHNGSIGGGEGGRIEEYDWDGNLVWEVDWATDDYMSHHDIEVLPNGNILMLVVEKKTYAEVLAAGFNPDLLNPDIEANDYMAPDSVVEIERVGSNGANVVWEWHVWDHLIQDFDPAQNNYGVVGDHPELVDPNGWTEGDKDRINAFWNHMNSIDYNADLDQVMLSVRGSSELWIIDHSTTTAEAAGHTGGNSGMGGDLMYRWGNPVTYDAGTAADQMLFDQHDAQWIEEGLPGEGNILIFNNGLGRNYSSVDEIVSPVDVNGNYPLTAGSPYDPDALTWTYLADPPSSMYEEAISGAQRLPNGNTLICSGTHGEFLEVTAAGETVWHYINPEVNTGILAQGEEPALDGRNHQYNAVFKIHRYPLDYAAFVGRDMTPGGQLELYDSPTISGVTHMPTSPTSTDSVWVTASVTDNTAVEAVMLTYYAGNGPVDVVMYDDGTHQDGATGDHVYGGRIPAFPHQTTVTYIISAIDDTGQRTNDPVAAPGITYSYSVVGQSVSDAPGVLDLLAVSDTGVQDDDITRLDNSNADSTLQFNVSDTDAGATVSIYADGVAIGSATSVGGATVVTTGGAIDLADGSHAITARQSAPGLSESDDSEALIVWIDTQAPTLDAWYSSGEHSPASSEALLEVPDDGGFSDPRSCGITRLVVEFSEPIDPSTFTSAGVRIAGNDQNNQGVDLAGLDITTSMRDGNTTGVIEFSEALPDFARYLVRIDGVTDAAGNSLTADSDRIITALIGDAWGDLRVNNTDMGAVRFIRNKGADPISPADTNEVRTDVWTDGAVNNTDVGAVRFMRGHDARFIADPVLPAGLGLATAPLAASVGEPDEYHILLQAPNADLDVRPVGIADEVSQPATVASHLTEDRDSIGTGEPTPFARVPEQIVSLARLLPFLRPPTGEESLA